MKIDVTMKGADRLQSDLKKIAKKSVPFAIRNTLNNSAFELQRGWRGDVKRSFTLRNRYTEQSIRVDKARGSNVATMEARTGSIAEGLAKQESGETAHGPVPGPSAAGDAPGSNKRTRLTRAQFRFGGLGVSRVGAGYGKRRQNAVALAVAQRKGERFVLLNRMTARGLGIFELRGTRRGTHMRLIWSVKKGGMRVPRTPTLQRSIDASLPAFARIQHEAFEDQLKRAKVFGY